MKVFDALRAALTAFPQTTIGNRKTRFTFTELGERAADTAGRLQRTLPDGARLGIAKRNSPDYLVDLLACLHAGLLPVLMDPGLSATELGTLQRACGLDGFLLEPDAGPIPGGELVETDRLRISRHDRPGRRRPFDRPSLDPATELCRLTSGSTRTPGCIEFSGDAVLAAAWGWSSASGLSPDDRVLCFAGLYNGLAFNTSLIPGLLSGASLIVPTGLPSAGNLARHLAELDPSILVAFPAAYDGLAELIRQRPGTVATGQLRVVLSSAAPLDPTTSQTMAEQLVPIADYYGIAETGPVTFNRRPQSGQGQGFPIPGVQLRVSEEGGLEVLSPSRGTRYLNYPGELEARLTDDGYYQSSDLGELRADGTLLLTGRIGDAITIAGRKFSPDEVVQAIASHPTVTAAAVAVAGTDSGRPFLGALVVADGPIDAAELRRHCLDRIAPIKVPERIRFVTALPTGGAGKVSTAAVRDLLNTPPQRPTSLT